LRYQLLKYQPTSEIIHQQHFINQFNHEQYMQQAQNMVLANETTQQQQPMQPQQYPGYIMHPQPGQYMHHHSMQYQKVGSDSVPDQGQMLYQADGIYFPPQRPPRQA
jgi:hypothetical protein